MTENVTPKTPRELLAFMGAYWEMNRSSHLRDAPRLIGMMYEMFSEPPPGISVRDRRLLKAINDTEAELITIMSRLQGLMSAFTTLAIACKIQKNVPQHALQAIPEFTDQLFEFEQETWLRSTEAHKRVLGLRGMLLESYSPPTQSTA